MSLRSLLKLGQPIAALAAPAKLSRSKLSVAAVCAASLSRNTGMLTVDLALLGLAHDLGISDRLTLFTVEGEHSVGKTLNYRHLTSRTELEKFDRILFWGDFLHARPYHTGDLVNRAKDKGLNRDAVLEQQVYPLLLLEGARKETLHKAIASGGTIYINQAEDDADPRYRAGIERLFSEARLVLMREPLSAQYASRFMLGVNPPDTLGVDSAFLLRPFGKFQWRDEPLRAGKPGGMLGYSFGRGLSKKPETKEKMLQYVETLAEKLGCDGVVDLMWLKQERKQPIEGALSKLRAIRECRAVVSDTYHCCVNAWREGVPTICIGKGTEMPGAPLSEKKKELLYLMFNMKDFYVFSERLFTHFDDVVENTRAVIDNAGKIDAVRANISLSTERVRARLSQALS